MEMQREVRIAVKKPIRMCAKVAWFPRESQTVSAMRTVHIGQSIAAIGFLSSSRLPSILPAIPRTPTLIKKKKNISV